MLAEVGACPCTSTHKVGPDVSTLSACSSFFYANALICIPDIIADRWNVAGVQQKEQHLRVGTKGATEAILQWIINLARSG